MAPSDDRWPQPSEPRYPDMPVLTGQVPVKKFDGKLQRCEKCQIAHKADVPCDVAATAP